MASITESQYWWRMFTNVIDAQKSADEANEEGMSDQPTTGKIANCIYMRYDGKKKIIIRKDRNHRANWFIATGTYPGLCSMKRL